MSSKITSPTVNGKVTIEIDLSKTQTETTKDGTPIERVAYWGKGYNVTKITWKGKTYNLSGSVNVSQAKPARTPRASF